MGLESGKGTNPEVILRSGQGEYSLDTYRNAPEKTLTAEEAAFVDDTIQRIHQLTAQHSPLAAATVLRGLLTPAVWKAVFDAAKAQPLLKKDAESKEGQLALAQLEAEEVNEEYDRKVEAAHAAANDLADFIEKVNGRQ